MTRDEILALKPGPELDALVAEQVMGWTVNRWDNGPNGKLLFVDKDGKEFRSLSGPQEIWLPPEGQEDFREREDQMWGNCPSLSTDISAAWQVVRKMEQLNWYLTIDPNTAEGYEQRYSVGFVYDDSTLSDEELNPLTYYQHYIACSPDEIPAAICKTALLANLEKPKKEDSDGTKN